MTHLHITKNQDYHSINPNKKPLEISGFNIAYVLKTKHAAAFSMRPLPAINPLRQIQSQGVRSFDHSIQMLNCLGFLTQSATF